MSRSDTPQNDDTPEALQRRRARMRATGAQRPRNRVFNFAVLVAGLVTIMASVRLGEVIPFWGYRLLAGLTLFSIWFLIIYGIGTLWTWLTKRQGR